MPHNRLSLKLTAYGVSGKLHGWCRAFLSDRLQRVVMGEASSDWKHVASGVPQGSVLGPILFILYINDIVDNLKTIAKLYADDTKLIAIIKQQLDVLMLQADLNEINSWTREWLIQLNIDKCKIMHLGRSNPTFNYTINNGSSTEPISKTTSERDLGVIMTNDLKANQQVAAACSKANAALGRLRRTFSNFSVRSSRLLYTSLVRPHLEYANSVWNPCRSGDIARLEAIQRRATKSLALQLRPLCYNDRLRALGLTTLEKRRERGDIIQLFKAFKSIDYINWAHPPAIQPNNRECRGHSMRIRREIASKSCRYNFLTQRAARQWNTLPKEAITANTVRDFKLMIAPYLTNNERI